MSLSPLPIDAVLPEIVRALLDGPNLVVQAPPGAGKTTRVPRALLEAANASKAADATGTPNTRLGAGEILVLEPRRLPARLAARRVAAELGEPLGKTVGYTVRFEDVSSKSTRIRFVTEGVLTRRLLTDATLAGVSAVVLDELHERHLQGDVALALLRRLQRTSRSDLRLVAMSATLDADRIAKFLGCGVVRSEGKRFDVEIEHLDGPDDRKLELQIASAIRSLVVRGLDGHVLVFLPGAAEIRRAIDACDKLAREHDLELLPLHGDLSPAAQDRAVGPSARRKIIVSTNVAESSVTIDGVVAVVDSGLVRVAKHEAWSGLATLSVEKTSRASAVQRAGRAGRTRPGCALRLYTKADFDTRLEHDIPEIKRADISQVLLEAYAMGAMGANDIEWLDPPKPDALSAAHVLLARLGAINEHGAITDIGKRMLAFPLHPRQSRLLLEAVARGVADDGALLAAILGERDLRAASKVRFDARPARSLDVATERSDLLSRLDIYREAEARGFSAAALRSIGLDPASVHATSRAHKQLLLLLRQHENRRERSHETRHENSRDDEDALLLSVLAGFPDRVARRKNQGSRDLVLAEGGRAELAEQSAVRDAPWMVAVSAEVIRGRTLVRVASGMEPEWLIDLFADRIREVDDVTFDEVHDEVRGSSKMLYEDLVIAESPRLDKSDPRVAKLLFDRVRAQGFRSLAPEGMLDRFLARVRFAATEDAAVRALSDEEVAQIVFAMCAGKSRICELKEADLLATLRAHVTHVNEGGAWSRIDELSPERVVLASGRQATIEYEDGKPPWVKSYLQDFFGTKVSPTIGGKRRVPIVLHLLAPNKRAVQITTDLAGFWQRHYPTIRKELMRKYPRHAWPEDTTTPVPMMRRRSNQS